MEIISILILTSFLLVFILFLILSKKSFSNKQFIIENILLFIVLFIFLMIMSGFFQPILKEEPFIAEGVVSTQFNQPDYTLYRTVHLIFWTSIILFLVTTICLSRERRKSVIKWGIIGLFSSIFLFGILNIFNNSVTSFIGRLIFINLFTQSKHLGEASIVLIVILPLYGLIAGSLIGFIISSLKDNKNFYHKSGFYLIVILSLLMLTSAILPVRSLNSSSQTLIPYGRAVCEEIQGCSYLEGSKLCEQSDWEYPRTPINKLPDEMLYSCDPFDYTSKILTESDLVNGKCVHSLNGETTYYGPFPHPLYGGYYLRGNKIYVRGNLCGNIGKIRYLASCNC